VLEVKFHIETVNHQGLIKLVTLHSNPQLAILHLNKTEERTHIYHRRVRLAAPAGLRRRLCLPLAFRVSRAGAAVG